MIELKRMYMYRLFWKVKNNGTTTPNGFGELHESIEIPQLRADRMNKKYPSISHWVEPVRIEIEGE